MITCRRRNDDDSIYSDGVLENLNPAFLLNFPIPAYKNSEAYAIPDPYNAQHWCASDLFCTLDVRSRLVIRILISMISLEKWYTASRPLWSGACYRASCIWFAFF